MEMRLDAHAHLTMPWQAPTSTGFRALTLSTRTLEHMSAQICPVSTALGSVLVKIWPAQGGHHSDRYARTIVKKVSGCGDAAHEIVDPGLRASTQPCAQKNTNMVYE